MKSFPKVQEMFLFCVEEEMINKCKADFRVEKMDIPLLVEVLGVPSMFKCRFGTICDGTEDLCNNTCIREFSRGHGLNAYQPRT